MAKKPSKKTLERKAMKLWGEAVHLLSSECYASETGECAGRLEAHHCISRSRATTRHDPRNGLIGCSSHHKFSSALSPHKAPIQFADYMKKHKSRQYDWVMENRNNILEGKYDYEARIKELEEFLDLIRLHGAEAIETTMWGDND